MITAVSTTPEEVLDANGGATDATVILLFARSTKKGDAMGVALTRWEALQLIAQLQEHLDATEHEPPTPKNPWGEYPNANLKPETD